MPTVDINYWAVLVAGLLSIVVGMIWYGPLFAKSWMKEVGLKESDLKKGNPGPGYAIAVLSSLLQAYVLAHFVDYTGSTSWADGALTALWIWLGFLATAFAVNYVFAKRTLNLWSIDIGYFLMLLLLQGAILGGWR